LIVGANNANKNGHQKSRKIGGACRTVKCGVPLLFLVDLHAGTEFWRSIGYSGNSGNHDITHDKTGGSPASARG
jgi:hypothetical protein